MRPGKPLIAALALAVPFVAVPLAAAPNATAAPAGGSYDEYVALGDSWSADVVIADANGTPDTTYAPVGCGQSHTNYPKLLAAELAITNFRDATCGGAETDDFYAPQSVEPGGTNPAQFDRLTPTTDLVTVGIGGNDAGIAGAAMDCFGLFPDDQTVPPGAAPEQVPTGDCKDKYAPEGGEDQLAQQILEAEPKVVAALQAIHRLSPDARVLIIDYFAAVPEHACYPAVPISEEDMAYLHATMLRLNAMVQRAAAAGGAEFVDSYTPTIGHDICQAPNVRYAEVYGPSVNGPAVGVPAHPNSAGAAAQFRAVLAQLGAGA
jgi:lysophospholipase L1-like esterase